MPFLLVRALPRNLHPEGKYGSGVWMLSQVLASHTLTTGFDAHAVFSGAGGEVF